MSRTIILLLISAMLSVQTTVAQGLEDHKNDDGPHNTFRSSEDFLELPVADLIRQIGIADAAL